MGAEGGVVAGLVVEERANRACVIVSAELEDKLLLLILLVVLSFLTFAILGPIPVSFPKLPLPIDPEEKSCAHAHAPQETEQGSISHSCTRRNTKTKGCGI